MIEIFRALSQTTSTLKNWNSRLLQILTIVNINCVGLNVVPATISLYTRRLWYKYVMLTLRRLMSYIYGAPILDVSRSHTTTQHSR